MRWQWPSGSDSFNEFISFVESLVHSLIQSLQFDSFIQSDYCLSNNSWSFLSVVHNDTDFTWNLGQVKPLSTWTWTFEQFHHDDDEKTNPKYHFNFVVVVS